MKEDVKNSLHARPEQIVYANVLEKGMLLGLLLVLVTYCIYVFGILKPYVPMDEITKYWEMNVHDYLHHSGVKPGWAWLSLLGYGDFLNFVGIVLLAGTTAISFLAVIPVLWKENDRLYALFAILEVIILSVAASGILGVGGH